jgi:hypothetical protein
MKLIAGWKKKFPKLWSVRLALAAAVLSSIEVVLHLWIQERPPLIVIVAGGFSLLAAIARVIAQPRLKNESEH